MPLGTDGRPLLATTSLPPTVAADVVAGDTSDSQLRLPIVFDGVGAGTVTSVVAGTGLTGGTITSTGTLAVDFGTSSSTACVGNDARLSDSRTPVAHNQAFSTITSTPTTLAGYGITNAASLCVFNVKDYGAVGDGTWTGGGTMTGTTTTNNTAIAAAITALQTANRGCLYFPKGVYKMSAALAITITNNNGGLSIIGDGPGVSQLCFEGANLGVSITLSGTQGQGNSHNNAVTIKGLAITTNTASGGTALSVTGEKSDDCQRGLHLEDVVIGGITENSYSYWTNGIKLTSLPSVNIVSVQVNGGQAMPVTADTYAFKFENGSYNPPSGIRLVSFVSLGFDKAVWVTGSGGPEGMYLHNTELVNSNWGVYWDTSTDEEDLKISNCHMNSYKGNVYATHIYRVFIHDCNLFLQGSTTYSVTTKKQIELGTGQYAWIHDNFLRGEGDVLTSYGVYISGREASNIHHNTFQNHDTDVLLDSTSDKSLVSNNLSFGGTESGNLTVRALVWSDSGTGNMLRGSRAGASARMTKASNTSITSGSWTVVPFGTASHDEMAFISGNQMVVPLGVHSVRLQANVSWDSSSTSYRYVAITKNGSGGARVASQLQNANLNSQINLCSGVLQVVAGDYFEVYVEQATGSGLNVISGEESNFSIEVVR